MYVDKEFADKMSVIIPQEVIVEANCQMLLPVYLALYMMDETNVNPVYRHKITVTQLSLATRVFNTQIRTANCTVVTNAVQWLVNKNYIAVSGELERGSSKFSFTFIDSPSNTAKKNSAKNRGQFVILTVGELEALFDKLHKFDKQWRYIEGAMRVYMYFRLKQFAWQYNKHRKNLPVWAGYIGVAAGELCVSRPTMTMYIKDLHANDVILPVYGSYKSTDNLVPQTIIVFKLCCKESEIRESLNICQSVLREEYPHAVWYPAARNIVGDGTEQLDSTTPNETALDIECAE